LAPQKIIKMQTFGASKEFIKDDEFDWEVVGEGIKRKIMGYDDTVMMVNVLFRERFCWNSPRTLPFTSYQRGQRCV